MYDFDPILKRIKDTKAAQSMTNEELSQKSGVPFSTLNKILSGGTREPKLPAIIAIANALDVSADFLIYGSARSPQPEGVNEIISILQDLNDDGLGEILKFAVYIHSQPDYKKCFEPGTLQKNA